MGSAIRPSCFGVGQDTVYPASPGPFCFPSSVQWSPYTSEFCFLEHESSPFSTFFNASPASGVDEATPSQWLRPEDPDFTPDETLNFNILCHGIWESITRQNETTSMYPGSLGPPEPVLPTEQTGVPCEDNSLSVSPGPKANQFPIPPLFMPIKEGPPPFSPSLAMSKSISTSSHSLTPGLSHSQDSPSSQSQMSLVAPSTRKRLPQKQSSHFVCTEQGCSVVLWTKSEQRCVSHGSLILPTLLTGPVNTPNFTTRSLSAT